MPSGKDNGPSDGRGYEGNRTVVDVDNDDDLDNDRATRANPLPAFSPPANPPTYEGSIQLEEATMQGASYMVERITPAPVRKPQPAPFVERAAPVAPPQMPPSVPLAASQPSRQSGVMAPPQTRPSGVVELPATSAPAPPGAPTMAAPAVSLHDLGLPTPYEEATAAVQNPGSRLPASFAAEPYGETGTALRANSKRTDGSMAPMSRRPGGDAPPEMDTAYVPTPGGPHSPEAITGRATIIAAQVQTRAPENLLDRIKGSQNARLGLIIGCGTLGLLLVFVLFRQKPPPMMPQNAIVTSPGAPPEAKPPAPPTPPDEVIDPAKIREKDALLERAILASEAGKLDEALALFRRYSEEESNPAAEFMVQLLQMQQSQNEKDR